MLVYFLFIVGIIFLVKGADWLVDGASAVAQRFKIPELVVGLTVVAFGTSAPELVINIFASVSGRGEIAIGNVLGSNMANILLILGAAAVISPVAVARSTVKVEIPFSLLAVAATGVLAHNFFTGASGLILSRMDGAVLLLLFGFFWYYTLRLTVKSKKSNLTVQISSLSPTKSVLLIIGGIVGLFLGGKWVVDGAVSLAKTLHISEGLIAISLVAVGTSLPELATSISAARKKKADIITGNAIGSNIFNILWVLGLSSVIRPINYNTTSDMDIAANLVVGILMLLLLYTGRNPILSRFHGFLFLLAYAVYIGLSITFRSPGIQ